MNKEAAIEKAKRAEKALKKSHYVVRLGHNDYIIADAADLEKMDSEGAPATVVFAAEKKVWRS